MHVRAIPERSFHAERMHVRATTERSFHAERECMSSRAALDGEGPLTCNHRHPNECSPQVALVGSFIVCAIQDDSF
jgi:hypothetical protein